MVGGKQSAFDWFGLRGFAEKVFAFRLTASTGSGCRGQSMCGSDSGRSDVNDFGEREN